jgi:hypothetical protein
MLHAVLSTPVGFVLATSDERGVLVYARPLPPEALDQPEVLHNFVAEGGIYVVAFAEAPGTLHAMRVPADWTGGPLDAKNVVSRDEAIRSVGEAMFDVCCEVGNVFATRAYAPWREESERKEAALRAVLTRLPVGEA